MFFIFFFYKLYSSSLFTYVIGSISSFVLYSCTYDIIILNGNFELFQIVSNWLFLEKLSHSHEKKNFKIWKNPFYQMRFFSDIVKISQCIPCNRFYSNYHHLFSIVFLYIKLFLILWLHNNSSSSSLNLLLPRFFYSLPLPLSFYYAHSLSLSMSLSLTFNLFIERAGDCQENMNIHIIWSSIIIHRFYFNILYLSQLYLTVKYVQKNIFLHTVK